MDIVIFAVQGSATEPYEVKFNRRSPTNLSAYCSCPAGQRGQYCKHRFNIMAGIETGIVSNNSQDVQIVRSWVPGTDLEFAIDNMRELENSAKEMKKQLASAKKKVAKAMLD